MSRRLRRAFNFSEESNSMTVYSRILTVKQMALFDTVEAFWIVELFGKWLSILKFQEIFALNKSNSMEVTAPFSFTRHSLPSSYINGILVVGRI